MSIKITAAAIAVGAVVAAAPGIATAGGEIQAYERTTYSAGYGAYAPPAPSSYARPMGMYQGGGYGGYGSHPCATMPYGYSHAGVGVGVGGNDFLTAGLLGIGLGYLLFH